MKRLRELLFPSTPYGPPIRLEFKCGHYVENVRPPVMLDHDRDIAVDQAAKVACPNCNLHQWRVDEREGVYEQLHAALEVVS